MMNDAMQGRPIDLEERAATILATLAPPTSSKISEQEVGELLGAGLDSLAAESPSIEEHADVDEQ
jgi:hypothetical protein